ncbi:MAG: hypothetical protein ACR2HF_15715 [Methylococcaceae bacterium]
MCIKPLPYLCTCQSCGWHKTFHPNSDAFIPGQDFVSSCPQCGRETLINTQLNRTPGIAEQITRFLGKRFPDKK